MIHFTLAHPIEYAEFLMTFAPEFGKKTRKNYLRTQFTAISIATNSEQELTKKERKRRGSKN